MSRGEAPRRDSSLLNVLISFQHLIKGIENNFSVPNEL